MQGAWLGAGEGCGSRHEVIGLPVLNMRLGRMAGQPQNRGHC